MRASGWSLVAAFLLVAFAARGEAPVERVVLRWQAVQGAAGYDLQVAADAAFTQRELDLRVDVAGYRLAPSAATRHWRVRAVDADGRPGPWSATKTIAPLLHAPPAAAVTGPEPEPEPAPLAVPPLLPAAVQEAAAQPPEEWLPSVKPIRSASDDEPPLAMGRDAGFEGGSILDLLRDGRPGAMVGWRANLLGVTAPSLTVEGTWPLPWLGSAWSAALRAGWWRERATVPSRLGLSTPLEATADVVPLAALALRGFQLPWARPYVGAGLGADLVVVRVPRDGALEASAALLAVAGAGRRVGPGEAFAELSGGLGGVDGPLGRLRTGGISLSVGYRLTR
jgi:hypothetical protein